LTALKRYLNILLIFQLEMEMRRGAAFFVSIMAGIATFLIPYLPAGRGASPSQEESPSCNSFGIQRFKERKEAPPFTLKNLNGDRVSLSDFKGKPVLLTFWATWCESCRDELPILEKFSIGKKDQLTILLITIDGERKRAAERIIKRNNITLPALLLLKENVMDPYGVRGWVPQTYLVNQEGKLVGKIIGQRDWLSPEAWSCLKEIFELR
jgi:peroxiredoxin